MNISERGIDLIKEFEKWEPEEYICPAGKPTIGYGHVILEGEAFTYLTEPAASTLLQLDLQPREKAVQKYVKVQLTQNQYDALISFVYNVGVEAFRTSTMLRKLNNSDFVGAAGEFKRWNIGGGKVLPGLVRRRKREEELFLRTD